MNQPSIEFRHLSRAFKYFRQQRRLVLATLACSLLGSVVTFVYPWLIGALIDHVINPTHGTHDADVAADRRSWLNVLTAVGLVVPIVHALAGYGRGHFNMKMGNRVVLNIRRDLFSHLQRLPMSYFTKSQSGSTVWTLMHEIHGINGLFHGLLVVGLVDMFHVLIALICLLTISMPMTLAILVLVPSYYSTFRFFNPRLRVTSERLHRSSSRLSGKFQESLGGMAVIKSYDTEGRVGEALNSSDKTHYNLLVRHSHLGHMMGALGEMFMHFGTSIIIITEGYLSLYGATPLTAGEFTRYLGYVGILYGPLARFAALNAVYQNSITSLKRVFSLFDLPCQRELGSGGRKKPPERGEIVFDDVSFSYADESTTSSTGPECRIAAPKQTWILKDITLSVSPGERIAIIGPSGCGKTTLVSLIPRLYDVTKGSLLIDGTDVRDYSLQGLRETIATVQQESFLFTGTVRENLLFAKAHATDEEIRTAAAAANADEFIQTLPRKYDTVLGERGVNLSGGQRQRLSIARALLRDPRILILDEATSALDAESEFLVQDALNKLMRGRTCFIIAHRLSTIRNVDRIIGLRDGRIVEAGSHVDLAHKDGLYARLMRRQMMLVSISPENNSNRDPTLQAGADGV